MYKFLVKNGTTVAFLLGIVVIAIFLISAIGGMSSAGYDMSTDLVALGKDKIKDMTFFNTGIGLTVLLIIIAVILMLAFGLLGLIKFPKAGMRSIATFAGLIILFFILKAVAPGDVSAKMAELKETFDISDTVSGFISGGILTTIGLIVFAALAMVVFEVRNAFK